MDLLTVTDLDRPTDDDALRNSVTQDTDAATDTALLGGGTWLFSTAQPHLRRLVDLTACGWTPIREDGTTVEVAATATLAQLVEHLDHPLVRGCCEALVGSAKIWNVATVGGNIALALPAGPMTTLAAVLDAVAVVWPAAGGERRIPVAELVVGTRATLLGPGDVLRAIEIPHAHLAVPTAVRKAALTPLGRSAALLAGRRDPDGAFVLAITAAVHRPVVLRWATLPRAGDLDAAVDALGTTHGWYDDPHGTPAWRRAMARRLAGEIRDRLA